jgi:hypothetical protein
MAAHPVVRFCRVYIGWFARLHQRVCHSAVRSFNSAVKLDVGHVGRLDGKMSREHFAVLHTL